MNDISEMVLEQSKEITKLYRAAALEGQRGLAGELMALIRDSQNSNAAADLTLVGVISALNLILQEEPWTQKTRQ